MTDPPGPEPLHQIIVDVIIDHILDFKQMGIEEVDFRMTHEFYQSFVLWALDKSFFMPTLKKPRTFMGARICVDDWAYTWRVLPRVDYD